MGVFGKTFLTEKETAKLISDKVDREMYFWQPFIVGLAVLNEDTVRNASPFELKVIQEVLIRKEKYFESRISKVELVERRH
jgi:hypothetical protein